MKGWLLPVCITFVLWGIQGFIAKLTTQYINPMSALLFNILGAIIVGLVVFSFLDFRPEIQPVGVALAILMGILGILGALGFLFAMSKGKVSIVSVISALYPAVSIGLAYLILKEPITLKEGIGIVFAFIAIVLLST